MSRLRLFGLRVSLGCVGSQQKETRHVVHGAVLELSKFGEENGFGFDFDI